MVRTESTMGVLAILGVLGLPGCGPSAGLPVAARQCAEKVLPGAQIQKVKLEGDGDSILS